MVFRIKIAVELQLIGIALGSSFRDSVEHILLKGVSDRVLQRRRSEV